jgi:predicted amidohydrolase YtcJ
MRLHTLAILAATIPSLALAQPRPSAVPGAVDLIVTNARIYTVDDARPVAEAMAVRDGRIAFVGSAREAMALRGPATRVLDAHGETVIPGMTDAHAHLLELGFVLAQVQLAGTTSYEEIVRRVAERARTAAPGAWIRGQGWDQNRWADTRFPTHEALSRAVPDHPVVLSRIDGHAVLANAAAMKAAGITAATRDPQGGRIERDARGNPTGVFVDNAMSLIERAVPQPSAAEVRDAVARAIAECSRWGLTGVHDAGVAPEVIDVYEAMAKEGKFDLRDYVMVADGDAALARYFALGAQNALYDGRLWIRAIKIVGDGALGSRGAAMLEPYSDDPKNIGLLTTPPERTRHVAIEALRHGFQLNVHAIGDRANRLTLDAFEAALDSVPTADHRFRIEHAQIVTPADIPRFAKLGVIPSMQASHQTSDM